MNSKGQPQAPAILADALTAAKSLLGCELYHDSPAGTAGGIIVETEAYRADDPASHTYRGQTPRNQVMFGPLGFAYIYFTYGMHYCFNIVTGPAGQGEAVLVRALEPTIGLELMKQRRRQSEPRQLTNGPAKLVQALGITKKDYGANLLHGGSLRLVLKNSRPPITQTTRVGIKSAADYQWRFYITGNPYISKP